MLRFLGQGDPPAAEVARARQVPGVTVVDEAPRMLLVEGAEAVVAALTEAFPGWAIAPEQTYSVPTRASACSDPLTTDRRA